MLEWWPKNFGSYQLGDEPNPIRDRQWGCSDKSCKVEEDRKIFKSGCQIHRHRLSRLAAC